MRRLLVLLALLTACASPASRIKDKQAAFDAYPAEVQAKIRAGQVDVGFTREQTTLALGRPDRVYATKTEGAEQETWVYGAEDGRGRVGLGLGIGSGGRRGFGGLGLSSGDRSGESGRVVFLGDAVIKVEERRE